MALVRLLWMFGCLALELCLIKPMPPHHGPPWPTPNLTGLIKLQTILIALYIVSAFLSVCPSRLGRFLVPCSLTLPPPLPLPGSAFSLKFSVREIRITFGQRGADRRLVARSRRRSCRLSP